MTATTWPGTLARRTGGVLAVLIGLYGLSYLARGLDGFPSGVRQNAAGEVALMAHVAFSGLAIACGPWQFIAPWRTSARKPHRWIGRVYGIACLLGGLSGAALAWGAQMGSVARFGFLALSIGWLFATTLGWRAARKRDFAAHRRWMIRSFALTFAAVTLRVYLPLTQIAGIDFRLAYPTIAWACWVPNLIVAELWLRAQPLPPPSKAARQPQEEAR